MAFDIFKMFRKPESSEPITDSEVPVSAPKNESADKMIERVGQTAYSSAGQIDDTGVENRISLRTRLANICNVLALKNALRDLESKGQVVSMDALVPLSYGGVAVLDYQNPEASIIPAEFDTELPEVLTTESLIKHSSKVNNSLKDSLGDR